MDTYEFDGCVFHVGDRVRVMTEEDAIAKYGMDDSGCVLLPSGAMDYSNLDHAIGGCEFVIIDISEEGAFLHEEFEDDSRESHLDEWYIDAEICLRCDDEVDDFESDIFDEEIIISLLS